LPSWSADGSKIVYIEYTEEGSHLAVMDGDGTDPVNRTHSDANDLSPSWSPDGSRIAFTSSNLEIGDNDVWVVDPAGGDPTNLTNTPSDGETEPDWSPDGSRLLFTGTGGLATMAAAGATHVIFDVVRVPADGWVDFYHFANFSGSPVFASSFLIADVVGYSTATRRPRRDAWCPERRRADRHPAVEPGAAARLRRPEQHPDPDVPDRRDRRGRAEHDRDPADGVRAPDRRPAAAPTSAGVEPRLRARSDRAQPRDGQARDRRQDRVLQLGGLHASRGRPLRSVHERGRRGCV
jgi:dipeptidyl aminopeptidase/acylaminoacyl peptidase